MSAIIVEAVMQKEKLRHYSVKQKGKHYFAVIDNCNQEKTSAPSFSSAIKKAKLLEIGYNDCMEVYSNDCGY